jgi:hypothetical protein
METEKVKTKAEENESQKAATVQKERGIDLQLELEKTERVDSNGNGNLLNTKQQHQNVQRHHHQLQQQQQQQQQQTISEKNGMFNFEVKNTCLFWLMMLVPDEFYLFFSFQFNPILCLFQCLFQAGLVAFLPWGTVKLIHMFVVVLVIFSSFSWNVLMLTLFSFLIISDI